jgi:hypothetical protein
VDISGPAALLPHGARPNDNTRECSVFNGTTNGDQGGRDAAAGGAGEFDQLLRG